MTSTTTWTQPAYTPEEIRAHRKAWIEALRSGNYEQGHAALHTLIGGKHAYCCLGVACEIAGVPTGEGKFRVAAQSVAGEDTQLFWYGASGTDANEQVLPLDAMAWLGLRTCNPTIAFPEGHPHYPGRSVATLNDEGETFAYIADAIESYGFEQGEDVLVGENL